MIGWLRLGTLEISFFIIIDRSDLDVPIHNVFVNFDLAKVNLEADDFTLRQDIIFNLKGWFFPLLLDILDLSLQFGSIIGCLGIGLLKLQYPSLRFLQLLIL